MLSSILSRITIIGLAIYFTVIHVSSWWEILLQVVGYSVLALLIVEFYGIELL